MNTSVAEILWFAEVVDRIVGRTTTKPASAEAENLMLFFDELKSDLKNLDAWDEAKPPADLKLHLDITVQTE